MSSKRREPSFWAGECVCTCVHLDHVCMFACVHVRTRLTSSDGDSGFACSQADKSIVCIMVVFAVVLGSLMIGATREREGDARGSRLTNRAT